MGTPYRYWRARVISRWNSGAGYVYTLEMRTAQDGSGSNLAVAGNGTASASSVYSTGSSYQASNAFDGSNTTSWGAAFNDGSTDLWLAWDFGAGNAQDINHFGLLTSVTGFTIVFEGSSDLLSWFPRAVVPYSRESVLLYYGKSLPSSPSVKVDALVLAGPPRPPVAADARTSTFRIDPEDGGRYRIVGTVKVKGSPNVPVHRRVVLINERSRRIVRETWSDPVTGAYAFEDIRGDVAYTTLAYDYTGNYRGVLADNLTAERMP